MSLSVNDRKTGPILLGASETTSSFDFRIYSKSDLGVRYYDSAADSWSTLTVDVDYTVNADAIYPESDAGGSITWIKITASGDKVIFEDKSSAAQNLTINSNAAIGTLEKGGLDRLAAHVQKLETKLDRALKFLVEHHGNDVTLPDLPASGTLQLAYNADDGAWVFTDELDGVVTTLYINTLLDDPDAATARATLGVVIGTDVASQSDADSKLPKDGSEAMTGDLPMGGNKITGLADGTATNDAATVGQIAKEKWTSAVQIGSGLAVASASAPALAALNGTDVAFIDSFNDQLRTYRWNGSTWSQVGSGLAVAGTSTPALAALNDTDVAFIDDANEELRTYRWNGSTWSQVGSGLAVAGTSAPALAALNDTDVAFIDSLNEELRTYRWNGSTWSQVGSGLAVPSVGTPALAALNDTDVAFIDSDNEELRTYRWNGSTWSQVGSGLAVASAGFPALAALNGTDVAFIDDANDELRTYRFGFSLGSPYALSWV